MVVAELFTNEGDEPFGSAGTVGPPPGTTFFQAYGGLTTIVFAYLGQVYQQPPLPPPSHICAPASR